MKTWFVLVHRSESFKVQVNARSKSEAKRKACEAPNDSEYDHETHDLTAVSAECEAT